MKRKNLTYYVAIAGSAACLAFLSYLPSLLNNFAELDDPTYILNNPHIHAFNEKFFKWAFIDFYAANWHPLAWISHALDYAVWGLNPLGHHLTSIILHAVNTALVVLLALKLLEISRLKTKRHGSTGFLTDRTLLIAAGVTGLLFGLHPVHVESVAWVSERKDLLCALFFLLSIIAYTHYAGSHVSGLGCRESESNIDAKGEGRKNVFANKHYLLTLGLFVLALMSKPMAVTLPVVLLILDWYPLGRIRSLKTLWPAWIEKLPFLVLSLISSIVTMTAQKAGGSMKMMEVVPLTTRALVAIESLVAYLGKMLLPLKLMPFYPYPGDVSLFSFEQVSAIFVVVGFTAAGVVVAKKQKFWLTAWAYYVVTLVPVLGIIQVGEQSMADRYTYLPSFGPFLIAGLGIAWVLERVKFGGRGGTISPFLTGVVTISIGILLSYATVHQVGLWRNGIKLWGHIIEKEPERVPFAYLLRGRAYENDGQYDKAVADYTKAIALNPFFTEAYNNLGVIYGKARLYEEAIEIFNRSISFDPGRATTYSNRGRSYFHIGQYDKALEDLNKAIALDNTFAAAYVNRGELYYKMGSNVQAAADFQRACDLGNAVGCSAQRQVLQELRSD
jgi:energy-converting hydrogenase Eha subunit A